MPLDSVHNAATVIHPGTGCACRYICNKYPEARQYYPSDPKLRAKIETALDWRHLSWYKQVEASKRFTDTQKNRWPSFSGSGAVRSYTEYLLAWRCLGLPRLSAQPALWLVACAVAYPSLGFNQEHDKVAAGKEAIAEHVQVLALLVP